jgi:hypothetical protein
MIFIVRVLARENLKSIRLLARHGTLPGDIYRAVDAEGNDRNQRISEVRFDGHFRYAIYLKRVAVWRLQYLRLIQKSPEQTVRMHRGRCQLIG